MDSTRRGGSTTMSEPYYRRIMADIRAKIVAGEWPPGVAIPSTRELTAFYRTKYGSATLAQSTVRSAITILIETGVLEGQQGLGVFVASPPDETP